MTTPAGGLYRMAAATFSPTLLSLMQSGGPIVALTGAGGEILPLLVASAGIPTEVK
jgi:hypothetical protein